MAAGARGRVTQRLVESIGFLASPWLAPPLLLVLFELPTLALPEPMRPTGELLVLLGLWLLTLRMATGLGRGVRLLLLVCALLLVLARLDRVVFLLFMGEEPLLYDQLFMLRHLFVLFGDVWSWPIAVGALGIVLSTGLLVWLVRRSLRVMAEQLEPKSPPTARRLGALLVLGAFIGSVVPSGPASAVRFMTPALLDNLVHSRRIFRSVQQELVRSPYRAYSGLSLTRKPDVYLIFVESYGRVVAQRPWLRRGWGRQVQGMQRTLGAVGWHAVSGFSRAPVMGGRSWLAEGSVLMGARVAYEAVFHHLIGQIARVPNFVSFLAGQGYHTLLLAPSDRKRRGVEEVNYYRYQRCVRFGDLGYHGPKVGWGIVPDQYSLEHTDEHVLRTLPRPLFVDFHMVTSHAPWEDVPELVADFRSLNDKPGEPIDDAAGPSVLTRLKRYVHTQRSFPYAGTLNHSVARRYEATILYDLALLERFLAQLPGDALVIIMGDHQPPLIAAETRNFDTPVHVLAKDSSLLDELRSHGFREGLWLAPGDPTTVLHEGLFSLLVRTLVRCCGNAAQSPAYLPQGVKLDG